MCSSLDGAHLCPVLPAPPGGFSLSLSLSPELKGPSFASGTCFLSPVLQQLISTFVTF